MNRKKTLKIIAVLVIAVIVIYPIRPRYGDRPHMSHKEWAAYAPEVMEALSAYGERERQIGSNLIQVNVDELTGVHGYSVVGAESFFGHRSTNVIGYITEDDADNFFRDKDAVWIGTKDKARLLQITKKANKAEMATPRKPSD
jgi:hypothetical protein